MDQNAPVDAPPQPPKERSSMGLAIVAVAAVAAAGVGVVLYQASQGREEHSALNTSGFDVSQVDDAPKRVISATAGRQAQGSSLGMITGTMGIGQSATGESAGQSPAGASAPAGAAPKADDAQTFAQMVREREKPVESLTRAYMKRSQVFQQYGREWMSHPDLKKLNDEYMKNHDPIAFLRGLAASPTFPGMVKKYAHDPNMQTYVKDVITRAPQGMISSGLAMAKKESLVEKLMDSVMGAMGLPKGIFGSADNKPIDQNAVMSSMMNNPDMQKAMGGVSGAMSNPDIQKAIQNNPDAAAKLKENPEALQYLNQQKK